MKRPRGSLAALVAVALPLLALNVPAAGAVTFNVACPGMSLQTAVNNACSGDRIEVTGTCNEAVTIGTTGAGCPGGVLPFEDLTIKGSSGKKGAGATVIEGVGGPGITVTGNAIRIDLQGLTVGSDTSHGIAIVSAHRVTLDNITTPSPLGAVDDGVNVDTLSTRTKLSSSTLNGNGGDGVEMGATNGSINNVTANDNGGAGINITGANVDVQRCTANNTASGNAQQYGFQVSGSTVVVQRSEAQENTVAQFHDTPASTGVINFRNIAGDSRAVAPGTSGKGFWEEGSGNYIANSTVTRNMGDGIHLAGNGNQVQRTSVSESVGSQVLITGSNNFLTSVTATRVSAPNAFESVAPTYHVMAGSMANYFNRCSASVSGTTPGDGFTIVSVPVPDPTTTGERNTRRPTAVCVVPPADCDPPAALK